MFEAAKSGIIIDPTMFHMGWTYEIKSEYVNVKDAVCVKHRNTFVEFAIKGDDGLYHRIKLTAEIIGSGGYKFIHKTVPIVDIESIEYKVY
jgi:hypothetical protein